METEQATTRTADGPFRYPDRTGPPLDAPQRDVSVLFSRLQRAEAERERAELANREKDQILAAICHDLRAPLHAILGWAQVARRLPDTSKFAEALSRIEGSVRTQELLINDILDVTRSDSCALGIERINLNEAVQESITIIEPSAAEKGVELQCNLSTVPAVVLGDRLKIHRIIWNLLTNALKFTPMGGHVLAEVRLDNAFCSVRISDTGCGINPSFLPRIFGKFEQDSSSSGGSASTGIGLGLAIVHRFVETHGGSITAESAGTDQGATFTVSLPAADGALV